MSCPSLLTLHDKASGGAGQCKGNKNYPVFHNDEVSNIKYTDKGGLGNKLNPYFCISETGRKRADVFWC